LQLDEAVAKGGARIYCLGVVVVSAAKATIGAKRRGPKQFFSDAMIDSAILDLLHQKGLPARNQPWNKSRLSEATVAKLGPNGPHKSTVDKRIAPAIERFIKYKADNDFQQSSK
jgi:hypothetical protein